MLSYFELGSWMHLINLSVSLYLQFSWTVMIANQCRWPHPSATFTDENGNGCWKCNLKSGGGHPSQRCDMKGMIIPEWARRNERYRSHPSPDHQVVRHKIILNRESVLAPFMRIYGNSCRYEVIVSGLCRVCCYQFWERLTSGDVRLFQVGLLKCLILYVGVGWDVNRL